MSGEQRRGGRGLRKFDHEEAARRFRVGREPVTAIAASYGVQISSVLSAVARIERRKRFRFQKSQLTITDADRDFIRTNWSAMDDREIGESLGRSPPAVRQARLKMGLHRALPPPHKRRPPAPYGFHDVALPEGIAREDLDAARCQLHLWDLKQAGYPFAYGEPGRPGYEIV